MSDRKEINEVSSGKLKSYVKAASADVRSKLNTASSDEHYDKIYDRERHIDKASAKVQGHLADYHHKHVQGLYNYSHREHKDGSFVQKSVDGHGPWHHLDSHSGKMTKHDSYDGLIAHVNKLHNDRNVSEEIETLDEVSRKTIHSYIKKASASADEHDNKSDEFAANAKFRGSENDNKSLDHMFKADSRRQNIDKAVKRLAKEEVQIDELSRKGTYNYIKKAKTWKDHHEKEVVAHTDGLIKSALTGDELGVDDHKKGVMNHIKHAKKREVGMGMAMKRLAKEEVEELDEVSKKLLGRYINKAVDKVTDHAFDMGRSAENPDPRLNYQMSNLKRLKRVEGISKATDKMAKEEVEELDEISMVARGKYLDKAVNGEKGIMQNEKGSATFEKRIKGIKLADTQDQNDKDKALGKRSFSDAADGRKYDRKEIDKKLGRDVKEETHPRKLADILEDLKRGRGRPKKKRNLAGEVVDDEEDEDKR